MKKIKEYKEIVIVVVIIVVAVIAFNKYNKPEDLNANLPQNPIVSKVEMSNQEVESEIDETLGVLMTLHYVSLTDKQSTDPNSVILDELQEAMNDLNKLQGLQHKTELLSKSRNELLGTTGLVLNVTTITLIKSYSEWIEYLRTVDINDLNIAEFQYQLALFQTSTHDSYLKLVENASLLPMIAVEFSKEEGGANSVNEELKNHFVNKIDELFSDILADNETFYKKTKNRYAVAVLIQGYKDFFDPSK